MSGRKITYDLVKQEFDERGYELISTEYVNNSTKLQYICPKHRTKGVLEITFANFTKGRGCPYCSGRVRKTQEEYEADLAEKKPTIKVVGKYVNLKTKIEHECLVCGYHWDVLPDNMLHMPNGCPKCGKRAPLTRDEVIRRVAEIDDSIEVIGEYVGYNTKMAFRCKKCDKVWLAKPNNIFFGKGCPRCKSSKGEKEISRVLDELHIDYGTQFKFQDCKDEHPLPFDFYIPEKNICIEYDGRQHFEPCTFGGITKERAIENFELAKEHDKIKDEYCQANNITLIRIPYWEYENIEQILSLHLH